MKHELGIAVIWGANTTLEQREAYLRNMDPAKWVPDVGMRVQHKTSKLFGLVFTPGVITTWVKFVEGEPPYTAVEVLTQDLEWAPEDWEREP